MTPAERHILAVKQLPCMLCKHIGVVTQDFKGPTDAHHIGQPEDRDPFLVVALCAEHHRGATGFHGLGGERPFRRRYKIGELGLLAMTLRALESK